MRVCNRRKRWQTLKKGSSVDVQTPALSNSGGISRSFKPSDWSNNLAITHALGYLQHAQKKLRPRLSTANLHCLHWSRLARVRRLVPAGGAWQRSARPGPRQTARGWPVPAYPMASASARSRSGADYSAEGRVLRNSKSGRDSAAVRGDISLFQAISSSRLYTNAWRILLACAFFVSTCARQLLVQEHYYLAAACASSGASFSTKCAIVSSRRSTALAPPPATSVTSAIPSTLRIRRRYWLAMSRSRMGDPSW